MGKVNLPPPLPLLRSKQYSRVRRKNQCANHRPAASAYHPPAPYNGTSTKVFASSSTRNETHWKVSVLCSGCSQWAGGEINSHGNVTFGWGVSSHAVDTPASASSAIRFHDVGKGHFELDMNKARLSKDDFGALVKSLGG